MLRWILLSLAVSGVACDKKALEAEKPAPSAREVTLVAATESALERTLEVSGTLAADERVTVAVKVPGRLAVVAIDLASNVRQGDLVARIDATDYKLRVEQMSAAVAQARVQLGLPPEGADDTVDADATAVVRQANATLVEARTALARSESLAVEALTTGAERDNARATFLRAEAALESAREEVRLRQAALRQRRSELRFARQQLADTEIVAPIDGVVLTRRANTGEYVAPGAPIAEIVRIHPLRLQLAIPERDAASVAADQPVKVTIDGDPTVYPGKIARLSPSLDQQNRTLLVEADIQNPGGLRPGVLARAQIVIGSKRAATLPASAIVAFAGLEKVIVVEDGKAVEKRVTTGQKVGDRVEIVSGLEPGARVVGEPGSLQQGQAVRVVGGT